MSAEKTLARPYVSILMPVFNETGYIDTCLETVFSQTYPADRLEFLVADGGSTDGTQEKVQLAAQRSPRVRLIDNPERLQAAGLNHALWVARGTVLVRMDAHAEYAPDYVERCVEALERHGADVAGGPQRVRSHTPFQAAVAAALTSPLGMGGAPYRNLGRSGFVDTVFLGAFRRRVFETVGIYDPQAVTNEDAELNQRIVQAGGRIFLDPAIIVYYYPRQSFPELTRQYFRYGEGRARTLVKHHRLLTLRPLLPFLGLAAAGAIVAGSLSNPRMLWILLAYPVLTGAEALRVSKGGSARRVATTWCVFPAIHLAHALGFARGLVRHLLASDLAQELPTLPPLDGEPSGRRPDAARGRGPEGGSGKPR